MTEPTKQPRPFDDPDTDEFAAEHDEAWMVDQSPETTDGSQPQADQARNQTEGIDSSNA